MTTSINSKVQKINWQTENVNQANALWVIKKRQHDPQTDRQMNLNTGGPFKKDTISNKNSNLS